MTRKIPWMLVPCLLLLGCGSEAMAPLEPVDDAQAQLSKSAVGGRAGTLGVVYVRSQGLYFDTFVSAETLPRRGPFQLLEDGETDFGPGDPGYVGGRWWVDSNANGYQDDGDTFLLCPLLPPGRTSP